MMASLCLLCGLASLIPGEAVSLSSSRVSVEEGSNITLRCAIQAGDGSSMQWLTPRGYVAFLNEEKVLRDRRFQLVRSSRNRLVIRISNVTAEDEGVYTCLQNSVQPIRAKRVNITVWAAPSLPDIEVIPGWTPWHPTTLICSTAGARPCPRITWLLGGTELFGNGKGSLEGEGKRCTASSTLRIHTYTPGSIVSCVVRHRALASGNLTTSIDLSSLEPQTASTEWGRSQQTSAPPSLATELSSLLRISEGNTTKPPDTTEEEKEHKTTELSFPIIISAGNTTEPPDTTEEEEKHITTELSSLIMNTTEPPDTTEKEEEHITTGGNTTWLFNVTGRNEKVTAESEALNRKSSGTLILVLVMLMLSVLLVVVQLSLLKLRKAHAAWRRENENSDQESNKSRSNNEEGPGQARNGQAPASQSVAGIRYNHQVTG